MKFALPNRLGYLIVVKETNGLELFFNLSFILFYNIYRTNTYTTYNTNIIRKSVSKYNGLELPQRFGQMFVVFV